MKEDKKMFFVDITEQKIAVYSGFQTWMMCLTFNIQFSGWIWFNVKDQGGLLWLQFSNEIKFDVPVAARHRVHD